MSDVRDYLKEIAVRCDVTREVSTRTMDLVFVQHALRDLPCLVEALTEALPVLEELANDPLDRTHGPLVCQTRCECRWCRCHRAMEILSGGG